MMKLNFVKTIIYSVIFNSVLEEKTIQDRLLIGSLVLRLKWNWTYSLGLKNKVYPYLNEL